MAGLPATLLLMNSRTSSLCLLCPLLALTSTGLAEWKVGRGAVSLETELSVAYDSNLRASATQEEDYFVTLQPTLSYRESSSRFKTAVSASLRSRRYLDQTETNSDDADASIIWNLLREGGHNSGGGIELDYFENSDALVDVNDRVQTKTFQATVNAEVLVAGDHLLSTLILRRDTDRDVGSELVGRSATGTYTYLGLADGLQFDLSYQHQETTSTDVLTDELRIDQTSRTILGTLSRPLYTNARVAILYGYRWLDRGAMEALFELEDRSGAYFGVLLTGPFLPARLFPKTTGTFRLAYQEAESPGLNDESRARVVGELALAWQARARTSFIAAARRSQDLSIVDSTVLNTGGSLTLRQEIGHFTRGELELLFNRADYVGLGRLDDRYEARISARYSINRTWSARGAYSYLDSRSNVYSATYDRHLVSLTAVYVY